jgi:hypothetical protein
MPEDPKEPPQPEAPESEQKQELESEVGEFVNRNVLEKDSVFFEG